MLDTWATGELLIFWKLSCFFNCRVCVDISRRFMPELHRFFILKDKEFVGAYPLYRGVFLFVLVCNPERFEAD